MSTEKLPKNATLADRIRWLRRESALSLQAFADKISFDKSYVSRLESGDRGNPSVDFIAAVSKAFGVTQAWLLEGNGEPNVHLVTNDQEALPDNLVERMEEVLCCVELVRLIAVEMPPLKLATILRSLPTAPGLTGAARAFWMRVFLRAIAHHRGDQPPLLVEQILRHHHKPKNKG